MCASAVGLLGSRPTSVCVLITRNMRGKKSLRDLLLVLPLLWESDSISAVGRIAKKETSLWKMVLLFSFFSKRRLVQFREHY